jgi:hypothetical protein
VYALLLGRPRLRLRGEKKKKKRRKKRKKKRKKKRRSTSANQLHSESP